MLYDYTRSTLERVSFDQALFCKELRKASKSLLPYEIEQLQKWLQNFTSQKPELKQFIKIVN
jgi:DNA replication protein DnaD